MVCNRVLLESTKRCSFHVSQSGNSSFCDCLIESVFVDSSDTRYVKLIFEQVLGKFKRNRRNSKINSTYLPVSNTLVKNLSHATKKCKSVNKSVGGKRILIMLFKWWWFQIVSILFSRNAV